jgi:hypothetical protein
MLLRFPSRLLPRILPRLGAPLLASALLIACNAENEGLPLPVPPANGKRAFVTSELRTGNLGGVTGADALCNSLAAGASLGGSWKAFLATAGVDGKTRLNDVGPWYDVDRTHKLFNNKAEFRIGAQAVIRTETGATVTGNAWTGALPDSTADSLNCGNWRREDADTQGTVGAPSQTLKKADAWMILRGVAAPTCATPARVYCFEQ